MVSGFSAPRSLLPWLLPYPPRGTGTSQRHVNSAVGKTGPKPQGPSALGLRLLAGRQLECEPSHLARPRGEALFEPIEGLCKGCCSLRCRAPLALAGLVGSSLPAVTWLELPSDLRLVSGLRPHSCVLDKFSPRAPRTCPRALRVAGRRANPFALGPPR